MPEGTGGTAPPRELAAAEAIAREAGALLLRYYGGATGVEEKGGGEPVTAADRAANALILRRLQEAFPDDPVVAEESAAAAVPAGGRLWLVDPMDGTREFLSGKGEFCVMIGLAVDGRPALGVVFQPTTRILYRGGVGLPAERVAGDRVEALRVSGESLPAAMRLVTSRSHPSPRTERMAAALGVRRRRVSGSVGLKMGLVAAGECDLYLHPSGRTRLWDTCAPEAILLAAGGAVTDFDGRPLRYAGTLLNRRGIVASNGRAHGEILRRLGPLFPAA